MKKPDRKRVVVSALGNDQPFVIADICSAVTDSDLNIIAVEQNAVHGLFMLFLVAEPVGDDAEAAAKKLKGKIKNPGIEIKIDVVERAGAPRHVKKDLQVFTVLGHDKVGVLKAITNTLANFRVNIERMRHLAYGEFVVLEMVVDASELRDVALLREVIQRTCDSIGFDTIIQPDSLYRQRRRLVVFDMDNTLVQGEIIDELARVANVDAEVSELTRAAMAGKMDFKEALRRRANMLKGLPEGALMDVAHQMQLTRGALKLVSTLKSMGFRLALISGGFTFFADELKNRLGFDYAYANELEVSNGVLTGQVKGRIIDSEAKGQIVDEIATREGLRREEIIAIGDGANDQIMLRNAGLGIAFNASEILKKVADGSLTRTNLLGLLYCLGGTESEVRVDAAKAEYPEASTDQEHVTV